MNNPLKYTDPSGYTFRYRDYEEQEKWYEGMAMYYAMNQINTDWMDHMRQIRGGGGGGGPDGWYSVYRKLKRKGVNVSPSEVMKLYDEQMNSHEFNGTITIKHTVYTDWFKITKNKSGEEISRKYMYTTSKDFFYDIDISHAFSPDEGARFGTVEDFYNENRDQTYDEIINQQGTGIKDQPIGPNMRFVEDPINPGKYIDMRHMLVIGKNYGSVLGLGLEVAQWFGPWFGIESRESAFSRQDVYSNNLGECFFNNYYNIPGESFTDKLVNYLNNHTSYDNIID